jgi:hypothetical protein
MDWTVSRGWAVRNHTNPPPHVSLQAGVRQHIPTILSADVVQVRRTLWVSSHFVAADVVNTSISPSGTVSRSYGWWWTWSRLSCLPVVADIVDRCFKVIRRQRTYQEHHLSYRGHGQFADPLRVHQSNGYGTDWTCSADAVTGMFGHLCLLTFTPFKITRMQTTWARNIMHFDMTVEFKMKTGYIFSDNTVCEG